MAYTRIIPKMKGTQTQMEKEFHLPRWEELPDLALYMDQVLLVLNTALQPVTVGEAPAVTAAMLNNYVKLKLTAPAEKKKYGRSHVARFLMICLYKRVLSMQEIAALVELVEAGRTAAEGYNAFAGELERLLLAPEAPAGEDCPPAVSAGIRAVAAKITLERLLAEKNP